jgi:hypothetical protein
MSIPGPKCDVTTYNVYNASRTCTVKKSPSSIHCHVNLESFGPPRPPSPHAMSHLHQVHHLQASTDSTCLASTYSHRSCAGILFLMTLVFSHYPGIQCMRTAGEVTHQLSSPPSQLTSTLPTKLCMLHHCHHVCITHTLACVMCWV